MALSKRRSLSPKEKALVRDRQGDLCGCGCKRELSKYAHALDHITEIWEGGTNALENFQALVEDPCHKAKTAAATKRRAKAERQSGRKGQYARRKQSGPQLKSGLKLKSRGFTQYRDMRGRIKTVKAKRDGQKEKVKPTD